MYRLRENAMNMNFPNTLQSHVTQTAEQMQHTARAADRLLGLHCDQTGRHNEQTTVNHVTMTRARLRRGSAVYGRPRDPYVTNPCNRRHIKSLIHTLTMGKLQQIKFHCIIDSGGQRVGGGGGGREREADRRGGRGGGRQTDRQTEKQVKRARKCLNFVSLIVELVLLTMELQSY